VAVWSLEKDAVSVDVSLTADAVYDSGVGKIEVLGEGEKWISR